MLIKVVASGPGGVLPSSNYILTHKEEKEKERDFPFSLQKKYTKFECYVHLWKGVWGFTVLLTFILHL